MTRRGSLHPAIKSVTSTDHKTTEVIPTPAPTKVHVVMGNDYPHAVWADEAKAQAWCDEQPKDRTPRIYYRVYSFDLIP